MDIQYVSVDIEASGQSPMRGSMISLGAVFVEHYKDENYQFYAELKPVSTAWSMDAQRVHGFSYMKALEFEEPRSVMVRFEEWLLERKRPDARLMFVSDNAGFDWQFVNGYFHHYLERNPFGYTSCSLTWFYKGYARDLRARVSDLRHTPHNHNALTDAIGNAEAFTKVRALVKP